LKDRFVSCKYLKNLNEHDIEYIRVNKSGRNLAYSICAASTDHVLLSLMAVFPEFRGQGAGTAFLKALQSMYDYKQAIIGEVERPELASNSKEMKLRSERIKFYKKVGFYSIPDVEYTIKTSVEELFLIDG